MDAIKEEIISLFSKIWVWILYVLVGLMAKYSYDIITGKRVSFIQALASAGAAIAIGVIASAICIYHNLENQGMFIVPGATILSDKIIIALMTVDVKSELSIWFKHWADKLKK